MKYLNLGCGQRYHPNWTNINFASTNEGVISHDLRQGIPFPDRSFDVVYHSHVLEHFSKPEASKFLKECSRVLRPQGILRVVVPDLEEITKAYLNTLKYADTPEGSANHQWMIIELLDQMVRNYSGGLMGDYLRQENLPNCEFVIQRLGVEAKNIIEPRKKLKSDSDAIKPSEPILQSLSSEIFNSWIKPFYRWIRYPSYRREKFLSWFLGVEYEALQIGRFRQQGEVHKWMYDRFSLSKLLEEAGFTQIVQRSATESYVSHWVSYNLDTEPDGSVYKPDSLFMEAIKPS